MSHFLDVTCDLIAKYISRFLSSYFRVLQASYMFYLLATGIYVSHRHCICYLNISGRYMIWYVENLLQFLYENDAICERYVNKYYLFTYLSQNASFK